MSTGVKTVPATTWATAPTAISLAIPWLAGMMALPSSDVVVGTGPNTCWKIVASGRDRMSF